MANGECSGNVCLLRADKLVLDVCRHCGSSSTTRRQMHGMDGDLLGSVWISILAVGYIRGTRFETNGKRKSRDRA